MRIKQNRLRTYSHRTAVPKKDEEGNSYIEYGLPSSFDAEVWPAGGKIQAEMYGQRLPYIRNCRIDGTYHETATEDGRTGYCLGGMVIREGDGIYLNACRNADPDYRVISIRPHRFLTLEVEKI